MIIQPSSQRDDIDQCVRTISNTPAGSVPLARAFGIDRGAIDQPGPRGEALLRASLLQQLSELEPRIEQLHIRTMANHVAGSTDQQVSYQIKEPYRE